MADVNITKVYLLNCPLENDYQHTLWFPSREAQQTYFQGKIVKSYTDFSYQRKNHVIRVPDHFDSLYQCNYVMYQNSAYSDKWFYAFIVDMKYVDDGRTDITIETDYIQTWLKDYTVNPSFIEREHCKDDTIGLHTVPEQLELGDYVGNGDPIKEGSLTTKSVIIASTVNLCDRDGGFPDIDGLVYNGVYSGFRYYSFNGYYEDGLNKLFNALPESAKSEGIFAVFMAPSKFIDVDNETYDANTDARAVITSIEAKEGEWRSKWDSLGGWIHEVISKPNSLNGYSDIKNKKLLTYPYCYLYMTNNSGGGCAYQYEYFNDPDYPDGCDFKILYALTPGGSLKVVPLHYKNVDSNYEEGLTGGKFPICAWNNDVFTNWLTQNAVNIPVSYISSAAQGAVGAMGSIAAGMAMGGPVGAAVGAIGAVGSVISGAAGVASTMGEVYQHSLQPHQVQGNVNNGDVTFASNNLTFTAYPMSIKAEYAEMIDNFFSMYGYKTNLVKEPFFNHRENYWYTKTVDANITGHIPNEDMKVIKNAYNKGITFWRANANFRDYSVSNSII